MYFVVVLVLSYGAGTLLRKQKRKVTGDTETGYSVHVSKKKKKKLPKNESNAACPFQYVVWTD